MITGWDLNSWATTPSVKEAIKKAMAKIDNNMKVEEFRKKLPMTYNEFYDIFIPALENVWEYGYHNGGSERQDYVTQWDCVQFENALGLKLLYRTGMGMLNHEIALEAGPKMLLLRLKGPYGKVLFKAHRIRQDENKLTGEASLDPTSL